MRGRKLSAQCPPSQYGCRINIGTFKTSAQVSLYEMKNRTVIEPNGSARLPSSGIEFCQNRSEGPTPANTGGGCVALPAVVCHFVVFLKPNKSYIRLGLTLSVL